MMKPSTSHLERTQGQQRDPDLHAAVILSSKTLTPTVKSFKLLSSSRLSFCAGQWLDVHIPNVKTVGGFSITSAPSTIPHFELAIQNSSHPPAKWFHTGDVVGETVQVRVRGGFIYPPPREKDWDKVVFVAGGVGINTSAAMVSTLREERGRQKYQLLYSAKRPSDFYYLERFMGDEGDMMELYVTASGNDTFDESILKKATIHQSRITEEDLSRAILSSGKPLVYVCGPPAMTDWVVDWCSQHDVERVYYERWW